MTDKVSIFLTDRARHAFREAGAGNGDFVRIGMRPGGCSGMVYTAYVTHEPLPYDVVVYEDTDLRIMADGGMLAYLDGLKIDHAEDPLRAGFHFSNPNATESCGCGASFAI